MRGWLDKFRASWLLVIGFALVYFGFSGAAGTVRQIKEFLAQYGSGQEYSSGTGFAPYSVPMGENVGNAPELGHSRIKPTHTPGGPERKVGKEALIKLAPTSEGQVETPAPVLIPPGVEDTPALPPEIVQTLPPAPSPTPAPTLPPEAPTRLVIESIGLDAEVVDAVSKQVKIDGSEFEQWLAPDKHAAGWHTDTALLGQIGNTVLNGHHNVHGKVFEHLVDVQEGDIIVVYGATHEFRYVVTNKMILPEKHVSLEQRMENARWIMPSNDERLTLVTCWPFETNTHRLIIAAKPLGAQ